MPFLRLDVHVKDFLLPCRDDDRDLAELVLADISANALAVACTRIAELVVRRIQCSNSIIALSSNLRQFSDQARR